MPPAHLHRQRGIALITALLLTALAVILVTALFVQQRYSIRLATNFQQLEQAYQYVQAAEDMATVYLKRDLKQNQTDSLHDVWALASEEPLRIDDDAGEQVGELILRIEDLQGYFNLNDILTLPQPQPDTTQEPEPPEPHEAMLTVFRNLLQNHEIPPSFSSSVLDWIDPDDLQFSPDSAESDYYLTLAHPYRTRNAYLVDPNELGMIKMEGVDEQSGEKARLLAGIMPYVTALPTPTAININTALPEVLLAMGLNTEQVTAIDNIRKTAPIEDLGTVSSVLQGLDSNIDNALKFSSNYFRLGGELRYGKTRLFLNSILFRSPEGEVHVIMRQFSPIPAPRKQQEST
ncbi:MAG: type II secretion system minor pseudopilin GspK [Thiothrix sp.]|nr:type II secretion system minor pseudopilin GspK [Thiothrix sp.]